MSYCVGSYVIKDRRTGGVLAGGFTRWMLAFNAARAIGPHAMVVEREEE